MSTETSTLDQRIAALPDDCQASVFLYLEFIEGRCFSGGQGSVGAYFVRSAENPDPRKLSYLRELGARLRTVREALNQSEESAAIVAGVTLKTYRMYEAGQIGRWATRKATAYATAWNVSYAWLWQGTGTMFRDDRAPHIERASNVVPFASPRKGGAA